MHRNKIADSTKEKLLNSQGNRCKNCGAPLQSHWVMSSSRRIAYFLQVPGAVVHHIIPVSRGGKHHIDNLAYLCDNCHRLGHYKVIL